MSRFVKTIEEVSEALPNSRWRNVEKLLSPIADEELTMLQPILGETLMDWLEGKSDELREQIGGLTEEQLQQQELDNEQRTITGLLCQVRKAVIFRSFANNTELWSVSINEGGGHNRMETGNYEAMSMADLEALAKKYWHRSVDRIETILLLLEKDAKSQSPIFRDLWRENQEYFYHHGDLLFPTLLSLKGFYKTSDKRLEYANVCPDIRFCQQTYITSAIGADMVSLLINFDNPPKGTKFEHEDTLLETLTQARMTLGLFLTARTTQKDEREAAFSSAQMSLQQLSRYIQSNQDEYGDAIKSSPLYVAPVTDDDDDKPRHQCERKHYHAISTLGPGLRRY